MKPDCLYRVNAEMSARSAFFPATLDPLSGYALRSWLVIVDWVHRDVYAALGCHLGRPRVPRVGPDGLVTGWYLLHGPAVSVRIAEEDAPDVVQVFSFTAGAIRTGFEHQDLTDLYRPLDEMVPRRAHV